ncbi:MAG: gamma-glutamylcyclotransferase [Rhodospirillales bacterium]|nr:gamma-glutamylcyclotransferase [Rhodospirillales bacterium]
MAWPVNFAPAAWHRLTSDELVAGPTYIFFYENLMDRATLNLVNGKAFTALQLRLAILKGYRRLRIAAADYPGVTVAAGCQVPGKIVRGRTPDAVTCSDYFYDDQYDRQNVIVEISGGRRIKAATYVASERMPLDDDECDLEDWRTRHRRRYLNRVRDWAHFHAE